MKRSRNADDAEIGDLIRGFLAMQARSAAEENRPLGRSVHPKGTCVRGKFEVFDLRRIPDPVLGARLAKGIYSRPGTYPATIRFSNSDPSVNVDGRPDMRGMAFYVELPHGSSGWVPGELRRHDFSMQSAPVLSFNDPHSLIVFAKVFGARSQNVALGSLPFRDQLTYALSMSGASELKRQPVLPYQKLRYWSATPFRHGPDDAVKYCVSPSPGNAANALDLDDPDALQNELIRHVQEDATMSTFDFGLQLLDLENMTYQGTRRDAEFWIENAAVEWPEDQAPFHTVARLTLLTNSVVPPESCDAMYIDTAENCFGDSKPIGGVNRMRALAVAASREARLNRPRPEE